MKPTLNEEIGMSQEGIDYVNSLEVVLEQHIEHDKNEIDNICKNLSGNISKEIIAMQEKQRVKKQSQKVWGFVFAAIVIIVTYFLNR